MSAATLDIRWSESRSQMPLVSLGSEFLSSRIGVRLREQRCPSCDSIVYSRRHNRCGMISAVFDTHEWGCVEMSGVRRNHASGESVAGQIGPVGPVQMHLRSL